MALKSTIFRIRLNVSDLDRGVYDEFSLSVARHPSETDARMMLRVAVFALHADPALTFGRGISNDDESDLRSKDLTGAIELWVELGTPDPDRLRKACGKARKVLLYAYGDRAVTVWWEKHAGVLKRFRNLSVYRVSDASLEDLASLLQPTLSLQATISDGEVWITAEDRSVTIAPMALREPSV